MCDIDNSQRRKAYKAILKKYGSSSFATRARDFNLTTLKKKHGIVIK